MNLERGVRIERIIIFGNKMWRERQSNKKI